MTSFDSIHRQLLEHPAPLLPPARPISATLTSQISALLLHPTLEAALHILNLDLPSAHFLVRHMQSAPAFEGMYLHGILHRIEGDYDNARAWYSDVRSAEVYKALWGCDGVSWKEWKRTGGEKDGGQRFLDEAYECAKGMTQVQRKAQKEALEEASRREIEHVIDVCKAKFGIGKWDDASAAWVKHNEEIRQMGEDQVSGGMGRRKF